MRCSDNSGGGGGGGGCSDNGRQCLMVFSFLLPRLCYTAAATQLSQLHIYTVTPDAPSCKPTFTAAAVAAASRRYTRKAANNSNSKFVILPLDLLLANIFFSRSREKRQRRKVREAIEESMEKGLKVGLFKNLI